MLKRLILFRSPNGRFEEVDLLAPESRGRKKHRSNLGIYWNLTCFSRFQTKCVNHEKSKTDDCAETDFSRECWSAPTLAGKDATKSLFETLLCAGRSEKSLICGKRCQKVPYFGLFWKSLKTCLKRDGDFLCPKCEIWKKLDVLRQLFERDRVFLTSYCGPCLDILILRAITAKSEVFWFKLRTNIEE